MVAFELVMHKTIEMWVLDFDNGQQAGAINVHWSVWQPKLRAWIMMGLVIL